MYCFYLGYDAPESQPETITTMLPTKCQAIVVTKQNINEYITTMLSTNP